MRADRAQTAGETFTMLGVERAGAVWDSASAQAAFERILDRVRFTDEVGWFDQDLLGLILPETGEAGARVLAANVRELLGEIGFETSVHVYVYPGPMDQGDGDDDGPPDDSRPPSGPHGEEVREPVLNGAANGRRTGSHQRLGAPVAKTEPAARSLQPLFWRQSSRRKRLFDAALSAVGLLLLSPLFLVVGLLVWATSPGPIIFRQKRVGLGGREFWFYKFRTMYVDAEERKKELLDRNEQTGPVFKMRDDPRITPLGKILRKTSVDELPQLWNVLIGDMSLVGPRPPVPQEVAVYEAWQRRRLEVPGGITCVWQVSGRSEIPFEDWVRMDIGYGARQSLRRDVNLLLRTVPAVLSTRGAR